MRPRIIRVVVAAALTAVAVGTMAVPALAHVTVNPNAATKGGFAKLTFRVPTEKDNASTTKIEVAFPTDYPIASVSVKPHPGWTAAVQKTHLATPIKSDDGDVTDVVGQITWTADTPDSAIKPGQFDEFDVSVGPLPTNADKLVFKVLQTYSDGSVVRWIEEPTAGAATPEHPAPTLTLTVASSSTTPTTQAAAGSAAAASTSRSDSSKGLAVAALVVAIAGAAVALLALIRGSRRAGAS